MTGSVTYLGNLGDRLTPENARSAAVLATLAAQRDWLTGPEVGLQKDSCILSARLTIEVARYFGLPKVRPLAVSAAVFNAPGFEEYEAWHNSPPETRGPMGLKGEDSWAVGIEGSDLNVFTRGDKGGRWNGHLMVQAQDLFFDFSLDQFSRPEKGMAVDVGLFPVQDIWTEHGVAVYRRHDGVAVVYRSLDGAKGYTNAPDWRMSKWWHRHVVGQLINRMKEQLA